MKKLCLILSSQQDLWELTTSSPPKHTKMLTVTSKTSKSEKSKFLINAWIFFKLACEDSPYWILFMNGIRLDLPLGNIMKIWKKWCQILIFAIIWSISAKYFTNRQIFNPKLVLFISTIYLLILLSFYDEEK